MRDRKDKIIENHLRNLPHYRCNVISSKKELEHLQIPSLVSGIEEYRSLDFIPNNTMDCAINHLEGKRSQMLNRMINEYELLINSIELALEHLNDQERLFVHLRYFEGLTASVVTRKLGYAEEKSMYLLRKRVLDKLKISLLNLIAYC